MVGVSVGKFDAELVRRGYSLNRMCYELNDAAARDLFASDELGFCRSHGLNDHEARAVIERDKSALLKLGGNMYFLAKLDRVLKKSQTQGGV